MASAQTTLPFEIERLIFELAAQDDRKIFPVLLLVCQRAKTWLEPQLYHTLRLDHRSTRINASSLKSIARRPPEFIGKHVRNLLLVAGVRTLHPSVLVSFLRNCASLEGLVIIGDLTGRWLLEPLAETGVKRLGIEVRQLFENSVTGHGEISEDEDEDGEADDADDMVEEDPEDELQLEEEEEYEDSDEEQPGIRLGSGFIDIADDQDDEDSDQMPVASTQNPQSNIDASPSVDLSHPLFRSVTHLDILDAIDPEDEELADMPWLLNGNLGAASLPALTHLSFNSPPHPVALSSIMQSSFPAGGDSTLKVLLIVFTASEAALAFDYVVMCPDPRVVVATDKDYYANWERGARGSAEDDIWLQAEQLVTVTQRSGDKVNSYTRHDPQVLVVDEKLLQEDDDSKEKLDPSLSEDNVDDPERYDDIPELVRSIVSFEDDPSLPSNSRTQEHLPLVVIGSVVSQIGYFRTTTANFSVFFVILVSDPLGRFMARTLPNWTVPLGRFAFSLNPGPWSPKEHTLVGIAANAGSQGQWATYLPTNAKLYYGIDMPAVVALFFGWSSAFIGFALAAMCRQLLIYDPTYVFPLSLQQVTLYRSMEQNGKEGAAIFWIIFLATFLWQFLPEYVFPFTASLAFLCWGGGRNHVANFLGSGLGGVGLLNITLDWSNITSTVITYPYSVQVIVFSSFVLTTWLLIPIAYFGNLWGSPTYNIMSNGLFTKNGSSYPFTKILSVVNGEQVFNQTIYDEVGLAYASYLSAFVWFGLFVGPKLVHIYKARRARKSTHTDRLTKIIEANYKDITIAEWAAMFIIPFIILLVDQGPRLHAAFDVLHRPGIRRRGYSPDGLDICNLDSCSKSGCSVRILNDIGRTAQDFKSYNTAGYAFAPAAKVAQSNHVERIQYALVGPRRLFANKAYHADMWICVRLSSSSSCLSMIYGQRKWPRIGLDKWFVQCMIILHVYTLSQEHDNILRQQRYVPQEHFDGTVHRKGFRLVEILLVLCSGGIAQAEFAV
ncbi:OPT oligopeptide transporter protein-domain-containing protein [Mycena amicta]|nr:OPT oligopeptide transporter protein-domain-containing protein [Mycena amicta]